jgi:hypothetical protein
VAGKEFIPNKIIKAAVAYLPNKLPAAIVLA